MRIDSHAAPNAVCIVTVRSYKAKSCIYILEMPSQSALSVDEKSKVKSTLDESTQKILTATAARIYFAHPQPNKWSYGGLQGALAFVRDNSKDAFMLRLVDLTGTRGVIWEHELYETFEYYQDRPFFHSFAGDVSVICNSKKITHSYPRNA